MIMDVLCKSFGKQTAEEDFILQVINNKYFFNLIPELYMDNT